MHKNEFFQEIYLGNNAYTVIPPPQYTYITVFYSASLFDSKFVINLGLFAYSSAIVRSWFRDFEESPCLLALVGYSENFLTIMINFNS